MQKILVASRLEEKTHSALKVLADRKDRTVAYLVRKAVEGYVATETKKEKPSQSR